MTKRNNIDICIFKEDLLSVFLELILQIKRNKSNFTSQLNVTKDLTINNLNSILILDEDSLNNLIDKRIVPNNYIFIIGKI